MAEIFPIVNNTIEDITKAYLIEAHGLSQLISSPNNSHLLVRHSDYSAYLATLKKSKLIKDFNSFVTKKNRIIYANDEHPFLRDSLISAHLTSCCELFNGQAYSKLILEADNFSYLITQRLSQLGNNERALSNLGTPLHSMDAVRTIHILRLLGLVTIPTEKINQISIGAGPGNKDINSIHLYPKITITPSKTTEETTLLFEMLPVKVKSIVISDNDPQREEQYKKLTETKDSYITALNVDTDQALIKISDEIKKQNMETRNFIVALRIDHRMLPNIQSFFKLICNCMDQSADLIITIGSGHTLKDFEGRINKLNEIFNFLQKIKLKPTLIKLHDKGTPEQQRNSYSFSTAGITTYQILHCKLKRKILDRSITTCVTKPT